MRSVRAAALAGGLFAATGALAQEAVPVGPDEVKSALVG
jgi:hypothetical protein